MLPLVVIPIAGIILLTTAAPYYAVSRGCSVIESNNISARRKVAILFGLSIATFLSIALIVASYIISPIMALERGEISIIAVIYGVFILFSLLGSR